MINLKAATIELIAQVEQELQANIREIPSLLIGVYDGEEPVGLFQLQVITNVTSMYHIHILNKHQAKGYVFKGWEALYKMLKGSNIKTIVGSVPMKNVNMMKVVMKTNFKCCGTIPNGIIYENELQDLVLFSLGVNE